jgi:hypothetical protein
MACIPGFVDEVGGTEELHGIAARAKRQSRNLFVQSLHSDTIEAITAWCQSNLAKLGKRRADRAEQIPMTCIPGFVDLGNPSYQTLHQLDRINFSGSDLRPAT